jgi:hypothetical protein
VEELLAAIEPLIGRRLRARGVAADEADANAADPWGRGSARAMLLLKLKWALDSRLAHFLTGQPRYSNR